MAHMPVKLLTRAINGAINCSREASEEGKRYECFRALAAPQCQPFCFVADTPLCLTCAAWKVSPHVLSRPGCFRGLLKALRPTRLNPNILWAVFRAHRSNDTFIYSYEAFRQLHLTRFPWQGLVAVLAGVACQR